MDDGQGVREVCSTRVSSKCASQRSHETQLCHFRSAKRGGPQCRRTLLSKICFCDTALGVLFLLVVFHCPSVKLFDVQFIAELASRKLRGTSARVWVRHKSRKTCHISSGDACAHDRRTREVSRAKHLACCRDRVCSQLCQRLKINP